MLSAIVLFMPVCCVLLYHISIMVPRLLFVCVFLLSITVPCRSETRYCELTAPELKLYSTSNELQQIPLGNYIRGYNLYFESSNSSIIDVFEPYTVAEETSNPLPEQYQIINVD